MQKTETYLYAYIFFYVNFLSLKQNPTMRKLRHICMIYFMYVFFILCIYISRHRRCFPRFGDISILDEPMLEINITLRNSNLSNEYKILSLTFDILPMQSQKDYIFPMQYIS